MGRLDGGTSNRNRQEPAGIVGSQLRRQRLFHAGRNQIKAGNKRHEGGENSSYSSRS